MPLGLGGISRILQGKSGGVPRFPDISSEAKVFYLDPDHARATDTNNPGTNPNKPLSTLAEAYDRLTSNSHDTIRANANSWHELTEMLTWSKSRTHLEFLDGANRLQTQGGRLRLTGSSGATNIAALKVTGTRNTFENMKLVNEHTAAESLYALSSQGEGNYYKNCAFHNIAAQHLTDVDAASLILSEDGGTFINCDIGADTVRTTVAANHTLLISTAAGGSRAKRCIFQNCTILGHTSQSTGNLVAAAASSMDRWVLFRDCDFINWDISTGTAMTEAIEASGSAGEIILVRGGGVFGCTNVALTASDVRVVGVTSTTTTSLLSVVAN